MSEHSHSSKRVLIGIAQVPFTPPRSEPVANELCSALWAAGHHGCIVRFPFPGGIQPADRLIDSFLASNSLDLSFTDQYKIDALIALERPIYLHRHPHKIVWLTDYSPLEVAPRRHVSADCSRTNGCSETDLESTFGQCERHYLSTTERAFAMSATVSQRLRLATGLIADPLYPPLPEGEHYFWERSSGFFLVVEELDEQRLQLVLSALAMTTRPIRVRLCTESASAPDLRRAVRLWSLEDRLDLILKPSQGQLQDLFARCQAVLSPASEKGSPWSALRAMAASKPILTVSDSGATAELVANGETGYVIEPTAHSLAISLDWLDSAGDHCRSLGRTACRRYEELNLSWSSVVKVLLGVDSVMGRGTGL